MIQFNLLPDVKLQYIKTRRMQRLVATSAILVTGVSLFVLVMMFTVVNIFQKSHLKDVNNDIKNYNNQLQDNANLPKILTVQNQLKSLPELHAVKPVSSRLFNYLAKIVPAKVNISQLNVDFDQQTITFTGTAASISDINQFVDTLKFTKYTTKDNPTATNAFSEVVLSSFSKADKNSTYTINAKFDKAIFDSASEITLTVPAITTTRSETDKPSALFNSTDSTSQPGSGQ